MWNKYYEVDLLATDKLVDERILPIREKVTKRYFKKYGTLPDEETMQELLVQAVRKLRTYYDDPSKHPNPYVITNDRTLRSERNLIVVGDGSEKDPISITTMNGEHWSMYNVMDFVSRKYRHGPERYVHLKICDHSGNVEKHQLQVGIKEAKEAAEQ
jgi:hypothetical protein